ncbi:hypothetical protein SmJEL517_g04656 [Synchytrium microbalum]|uniref:SET domain-containing protein n=1 Tax=Synchytrium microbalum TaxID=1806994 RepID=A0A507C3T1_9FUNG|nr:uncharacterized protein SmJEL517_g04656 [Synchytrium microbalum]TPX32225.1 hypothetical protein SmJEL517_g04656 [Synchytrium microbalum]
MTTKSLPKGWPVDGRVRYINENEFDKRIPREIIQHFLRLPITAITITTTTSPQANLLDSLEIHAVEDVPKSVVIRPIAAQSHPANGQYGLFAAKKIAPYAHVLNYNGLVVLDEHASPTSDYCFRVNSFLAIDAEFCGSQARFINDYRGVAQRANAEFKVFRDAKKGGVCVGVFSLKEGIGKGQEILLSYGKGFWKARAAVEDVEDYDEMVEV